MTSDVFILAGHRVPGFGRKCVHSQVLPRTLGVRLEALVEFLRVGFDELLGRLGKVFQEVTYSRVYVSSILNFTKERAHLVYRRRALTLG